MSESTPEPAPVAFPPLPAPAAHQAWEDAAAWWPALLAGCGQALAVKDAATGRYLAIGPAWQVLFGLEPAECLGRTDAEIFGGALAAPWRAADQMALERPDAVASEHAFEWRGRWRELCVTRQGANPGGSAPRRILSHWVDVRAQHEQARRLAEALSALQQAREQADAALRGEAPADDLRDPVSGLPGRAPFVEQLRREFDLSAREGREMSLVLLEVDSPAEPEPEVPVLSGDELAREVGNWLRSGTRTMDATGRLGPARYAILLSGAGLPIAARRAEALRSARQPLGPQPNALTLSIGVASYPLSADTPEGLMQAAEQALLRARGRGGNQVALAGLSLGGLPPG